ncbi:MAG: glutamine-hydrolyzing GMP synthase [Planctomycetes bacterium]|nr:glutamine-hydrolyzing GMP synthase [Planctomycetota bacterium]
MSQEEILILDLGSQYTQLIARRIREIGVFSEITRHDTPAAELRARAPKGIVLSGGPSSVYDDHAPTVDPDLFELGIPVLGICYGEQLLVEHFGGKVQAASEREYGRAEVTLDRSCPLFAGLGERSRVWMSHGDRVDAIVEGLHSVASTPSAPFAAVQFADRPFYGLQFHPEVKHSEDGRAILTNFVRGVCGCVDTWKVADLCAESIAAIRAQVGDSGVVVCGLSGGIDSAVTAALVDQAIGERLHCIFVDNGLLRKGEVEEVEAAFRPRFGDRLQVVSAGERFVGQLAGVTDPELKRKRIGHEFISVFKDAVDHIPNAHFLAQGTLYPDVIESISPHGGPSATIKSHHNVGGLPEELGFELVEPLRQLFKDEVRELAADLGLPEFLIQRQPFPGPGLAVRIPGEVTAERLAVLREADAIVRHELETSGASKGVWQWFCVLLPVSSVGVMGDQRTYEDTCVVRAVESTDGMTADWARIDPEVLATISNRIINEVRGINRVCYDISSKPPATIEWE